ncbi:glycosyltransferase family 2 protein [Asticcacaulis machinosus]|uniref:Glycosyltransferase family 2 protein n=1 Tax=Asticcacaulis machinosus TaxID=2984211 RepID=A0ABT5HJP1_9CAUL|nr:glycosyltransferase family 2 protein [Asticcacaulis machinosus]MDC7676438.1 glycosyltransferase family 2 protein [Asticcacaulis machinosus]
MKTVAVIIPYYQREAGLLRRALQSIADQNMPQDVHVRIVIADDESPLPVEAAIEGFEVPQGHELVILHRKNGGPGAARNTGLDSLDAAEVDYVMFLDSDDVWHPDHLKAAMTELDAGSDFYFANSQHDDKDTFYYFDYMQRHHKNGPDYEPVRRQITPAEAVDAIADECLPHASQVAFNFKRNPRVRFDEGFRRACEDQLFFLDLSAKCERITYSMKVMGSRGTGVSVYRETMAWGSLEGPNRIIDELLFRKRLLQAYKFGLGKKIKIYMSAQPKINHWLFLVLRHMKYNPDVSRNAWQRYFKQLPQFLICIPIAFVSLPFHYLQLRSEAKAHVAEPVGTAS